MEFATNKYLLRFGNGTFATQLLSWVAIENYIVAAARVPGGATKLALTQEDRGRLSVRRWWRPAGSRSPLVLALLRLRRL